MDEKNRYMLFFTILLGYSFTSVVSYDLQELFPSLNIVKYHHWPGDDKIYDDDEKYVPPQPPNFNLSSIDVTTLVNNTAIPGFLRTFLNSTINLVRQNPAIILNGTLAVIDALFVPKLPRVDLHKWWGDGPKRDHDEDTTIRHAPIQFSPEMISLLVSRLRSRVPLNPPLRGVNMSYGFNSDTLEYILNYWEHEYDFSAREKYLNRHPHYKTNVQGLDISFYVVSPKHSEGKTVYPIMLCHGWPQLNIEFMKTAELLANWRPAKYDFVFQVIVPSHPGYAYSQYTNKPGLASYEMAIIYRNLMRRLGHYNFFVHGGDLGYIIAKTMTTLFPGEVMGFHGTFAYTLHPRALAKYAIGDLQPSLVVEPQYQDRMYPLSRLLYKYLQQTGYLHEQGTKPDNLAGMRDTPTGLAAWILYFFVVGASFKLDFMKDGRLLEIYDIDELLDVLTVHWDSRDFVTTVRHYSETFGFLANPEEYAIEVYPTEVPFAPLKFRYEVVYFPDGLLRDKFRNLVHSTTLDYGGHFAAFENPDVLARDIFSAVDAFVDFHKNNTGLLNTTS